MNTVLVSAIPVRLRSRAAGLQMFFTHVLGDVISPPIIGAISDQAHSLRHGLQICWMMVLVAGAFWMAGKAVLTPFAVSTACRQHGSRKGDKKTHADEKPATLCSLLSTR